VLLWAGKNPHGPPGALLFAQQKAATARGAVTAFYAHTLTTKEVNDEGAPDPLTSGYGAKHGPATLGLAGGPSLSDGTAPGHLDGSGRRPAKT
jgi:hypothetical protein